MCSPPLPIPSLTVYHRFRSVVRLLATLPLRQKSYIVHVRERCLPLSCCCLLHQVCSVEGEEDRRQGAALVQAALNFKLPGYEVVETKRGGSTIQHGCNPLGECLWDASISHVVDQSTWVGAGESRFDIQDGKCDRFSTTHGILDPYHCCVKGVGCRPPLPRAVHVGGEESMGVRHML